MRGPTLAQAAEDDALVSTITTPVRTRLWFAEPPLPDAERRVRLGRSSESAGRGKSTTRPSKADAQSTKDRVSPRRLPVRANQPPPVRTRTASAKTEPTQDRNAFNHSALKSARPAACRATDCGPPGFPWQGQRGAFTEVVASTKLVVAVLGCPA